MPSPETRVVKVFPDTYLDSVLQLSGTRALSRADGVSWASAAMATTLNLDILRARGFASVPAEAGVNDLLLAVAAESDEAAEAALVAGEAALFSPPVAGSGAVAHDTPVRSLALARGRLAGAGGTLVGGVAVVSVPGPYAAVEAHKALTAGLHVLLFSDNVCLDEEIELKARATDLGLLVMGPGAGTAMLGGTGLGFANAVKAGRVGVVAAAGTGAQEVMSLLDQWGAGVSHVIGLGGRDLTGAVGGVMARMAVAALRDDPGTDAIVLVSKPPDPAVVREVAAHAGATPLVAALLGLGHPLEDVPASVTTTTTLEQGVVAAMAAVGLRPPDRGGGLLDEVASACDRLGPERTLIRGLFSGGTLCYESLSLLSLLSGLVGPVYSNTPIDADRGLPAPAGAHTCLDLGEEEYTKGRPHPMIDPEARVEMMRQVGVDCGVAVVLIDVILGYGSHPDPAGVLAPVAEAIMRGSSGGPAGRGPQVVAYVLGTEGDPQGLADQRRKMRDAGCIVAATAARAALAAAALATRRPGLVCHLP